MAKKKKGNSPPKNPQGNSHPPSPPQVPFPTNADMAGDGGDNSASKKDESKKSTWNSVEIAKFAGEVFLAIVGLLALRTYRGQLFQMMESNRINRESLQSVQRAFLTFSLIDAQNLMVREDPTEKATHVWAFKAVFENSGNTPAM